MHKRRGKPMDTIIEATAITFILIWTLGLLGLAVALWRQQQQRQPSPTLTQAIDEIYQVAAMCWDSREEGREAR